jgi:hypothetical protein
VADAAVAAGSIAEQERPRPVVLRPLHANDLRYVPLPRLAYSASSSTFPVGLSVKCRDAQTTPQEEGSDMLNKKPNCCPETAETRT